MLKTQDKFRFKVFLIILFLTSKIIAQNTEHIVRITENTGKDTIVQPLLGVISGPDPGYESKAPDLTPHLHDIGITSIRNNDYWDDRLDLELIFSCPDTSTYPSWDCDPNNENHYNWTKSDQQFQSYIDGGFEPFFRVGGEIQCGARLHDYKGPRKDEEDNWIQAAVKVVDRYNNWQGKNNVLNYLDIFTEFPNEKFWDRPDNEFYPFWAKTYQELKKNFPDLKMGGPGFTPSGFIAKGEMDNKASQTVVKFLEYLYENEVCPDWIGWHLFDFWPEKFYNAAMNYRKLLKGEEPFSDVKWAGTGFFEETELIIDAYNLCTGGVGTTESGEPYTLSEFEMDTLYNTKKGSSLLTAVWITLQFTEVKKAFYYRCGDSKSSPEANPGEKKGAIGGEGLFYGDPKGTYKPMAHVIRFWSEIANNFPVMLTTDYPLYNQDSLKLYALAAKSRKKEDYALLIANTEKTKQAFSVNIFNKDISLTDYQIEYAIVNDEKTGENFTVSNNSRLIIQPENVMLVKISKIKENVSGVSPDQHSGNKTVQMSIYPNPGKEFSKVSFYLPFATDINLSLYNISGRHCKQIFKGQKQKGTHTIKFSHSHLPAGVYFIRLKTSELMHTTKMTVF